MEDLFNSKKTKNPIKKKDLVLKKCTHPLVDFFRSEEPTSELQSQR